MKRVAQKELARRLGVSQTTVSAVLRNDTSINISEETRQRVLDVAEKAGYWPNRMANVLLSRKSRIIGVAHSGAYHQVIIRKLKAVVTAVNKSGYMQIVQDLLYDHEGVNACQFFRDLNVDGMILINVHPAFMANGFARYLKGIVPTVAIDIEENPHVAQFKSDRHQGFRLMTEHLISLGYKKIATLSPPEATGPNAYTLHFEGMRGGVAEALSNAGLEGPRVIYEKDAPDLYSGGKRAMARLLDSGELPDAVICSNDSWAIGALSEAEARGIRVPQELAVVGFQNEMQSLYSSPPLTTIEPPVERLAERALECLIRQMQGEIDLSEPFSSERLPLELVVRQSCGASIRSLKAKR